jgi:glycerol-3-phosphate dehydrogenase
MPTIFDFSQPNLIQEMMRLEFSGKLDDVPFDRRIKVDF